MEQAVQRIRKLVRTHKGRKPTVEKNTFDQGVDAGLILARQALLTAKFASKQGVEADGSQAWEYCKNFISSILSYFRKVCGRKLPTA